MATTFARNSSTAVYPPTPSRARDDRPAKRKKDAQRTDIWTSLLRQTREAQARSRTATVQHRSLILCGGTPDDQQALVRHNLTRPPPSAPPSRNRDQRPQKPKGEVKLSNRFAYGYGHVTLFSPPQQGVGGLGAEAEEVGRVEVHTLPEPEEVYEGTLRRLLVEKKAAGEEDDGADDLPAGNSLGENGGDKRPAVCLLLSWKEPWRFLALLRRWLQILARALLAADALVEDPLDVLKQYHISLTVVVQHVEAQEGLEREGYKEDSFDYISQCLRTCLLPISAALVYTSSNPPPQQPGAPLSEVQKVLFTALGLDLTALSPAPGKSTTGAPVRREDQVPKHNVVDRMAIVVPSGWDSVGKIRLLSETFSPEVILEAWTADLNVPMQPSIPTLLPHTEEEKPAEDDAEKVATDGTEQNGEQAVYATSETGDESDLAAETNQTQHSALSEYESTVLDPNAHKAPKPPTIEVTTKPDQTFLAEMRAHLQEFEAQDAEKARQSRTTGGGGPGLGSTTLGASGRVIGLPSGEQTGALNDLGDVSFNVGGVSYNAVTAEAAIERLKRSGPQASSGAESSPTTGGTPRTTTPRPPRREDREASSTPTQAPSTGKGDLPVDKLEEYFHSLMKKGGGGSAASTPSKSH